MTISFTGLSNIKVLKSEKQGEGTFWGTDNKPKHGELNVTEVKLKFNLTNDAAGKDMEELQTELKKAGRGYSYNTQCPDTIELHLKNIEGNDGVVSTTRSLIHLNSQDINISSRKDLGLYTYLAKLVKRISQQPEISQAQEKYITLISKAIKENAVHFIDYVM